MEQPTMLRFYIVTTILQPDKLQAMVSAYGIEALLSHVPLSAELTYLVSPDIGYRFCSAERMTRLQYISMELEWPTEFIESDNFDAFESAWRQVLFPEDDTYHSASSVVTWNEDTPVFKDEYQVIRLMGEFTSYNEAESYYHNFEV